MRNYLPGFSEARAEQWPNFQLTMAKTDIPRK